MYDIDFMDRATIGYLARKSVGEQSNSVRLLGYNSQICYVFEEYELFKAYRCPQCDTFFNTVLILERYLTTCCQRATYENRRTCVSSVKLSLTDLTDLVSLIQTTKDSLTTWHFLILNHSMWNMNTWGTPKQRHGLRSIFHFRYQPHSIWYNNPFPLRFQSLWPGVIFENWFGDFGLAKSSWNENWKRTSFKLKTQQKVELSVPWQYQFNVAVTAFELKQNTIIPKTFIYSFNNGIKINSFISSNSFTYSARHYHFLDSTLRDTISFHQQLSTIYSSKGTGSPTDCYQQIQSICLFQIS